MKTLSSATQAAVDARGYNVFYLYSITLPGGTTYLANNSEDVTWNSQSWQATVSDAGGITSRPDISSSAEISLSRHNLANQAVAFGDGIDGAGVQIWEAYSTALDVGDPVTLFKGQEANVRTRGDDLVLQCQNEFATQRAPGKTYDRHRYPITSKRGTYVMNGRTVVIE